MKKILICGLGNINKELKYTRHNIGFIIIDYLYKILNKKNINDIFFECQNNLFNNFVLYLLKPNLGINLSGVVLKKILDNNNFDDILIIYDDATMDFLKCRFKIKRSFSETHNGIRNIYKQEINQKIIRLKIGVGCYKDICNDIEIFVMKKFTNNELLKIHKFTKLFFLNFLKFYNINDNFNYEDLKKFNGVYNK
jgi:peptidyl-tRNA hydrolase, PTH1 family